MNALLYLRVSTPRQAHRDGLAEGFSLPAQRAACVRKADELGALVAGEFVDAGASARSADRDGLQALLSRLADTMQPPISYVIVHKLDRLARSRADDVELLMAIHAAGAQLVSVSEQIDETPAGMLLHGIMASIAEFYSHNLSAEAKKGIAQKAQRGGTIGFAPTGYLNVTKRVTLRDVGNDAAPGATRSAAREVKTVEFDPDRAPHVKWAFETYASGDMSLSELTVQLAARGLTSRDTRTSAGAPLTRSSLHRLLRNPYYMGKIRHRDVVYDGLHEPLVSAETFQAVQDVLNGRRIGGDRSWKHGHYLNGTVTCARCDSRLGFTKATGRGGQYDYFYCLGRAKKRTDCDLPYLPSERVEHHVERLWERATLTPAQADAIRAETRAQLAATTKTRSRDLQAAERELTKLTRAKKRLLDAYLAEVLDVADFAGKQAELEAQLAAAQARLDGLTADNDFAQSRVELILSVLEQAGALYKRCPSTARQQLNQAMFSRIRVDVDGTSGAEERFTLSRHDMEKTTNPARPSGPAGFERDAIGGSRSTLFRQLLRDCAPI